MLPGACGRDSVDLAATTIVAPSEARPRAMALPMPLLDPVTTATLPSNDMLLAYFKKSRAIFTNSSGFSSCGA